MYVLWGLIWKKVYFSQYLQCVLAGLFLFFLKHVFYLEVIEHPLNYKLMCFSKFEKFLVFNHSIYFSVSSSLFLGFQYPINETLFLYIFRCIQLCLRYQWAAEMLCGAFEWHLCFRYSNANAILCRQYSPLERKLKTEKPTNFLATGL